MSSEWTVRDSANRVLDALALWLERNEGWEYRLEFRADYVNKKWHARLRHEINDGAMEINGRGDTAHEATIEAFNLADVPRQ